MKSINWKFILFPITFVLSILFGFWSAANTYLYQEILRNYTYQKADIMLVPYHKPFTTQLMLAAEFFVAYIIPCGLVWLVYFIIIRFLTTRSRVRKLLHSK